MVVNKPVVSRWILGFYAFTLAFLVGLTVFLVLLSLLHGPHPLALFLSLVPAFASAFIALLLRSILLTRYILTPGRLEIRVSRLVSGPRVIPLGEVVEVKRTLIPFGLRLFGASFHAGYYHVPGLGRAFLAITNFRDGVLIKTRGANYIVTPSKPEEFVGLLREFLQFPAHEEGASG